jgi:hypothetical protein
MTSQYFTYEKRKVIQALRYHFISRKEIKFMIVLVNVFAIASAALYYTGKISPFAFLISSLLWIAMMAAFWFFLPSSIYKKSVTFRDRFRAALNSSGFSIENERGSKEWDWKEFSGLLESPHFFHLYFDSRSFFIVPKDAFEGDDVHEARKILREKIGKG